MILLSFALTVIFLNSLKLFTCCRVRKSNYNNLMIPGATSDCWPHVHLSADPDDNHLGSLRVICGQRTSTAPAVVHCLEGNSLQISNYPNSSKIWVGTDPIYWPQQVPPRNPVVRV